VLFYLDDCSIADSLAPSVCSNLVDQDNQTIQSKRIFPPLHKMVENKGKTVVALERSPCLLMKAEMEFLDINLTKDSSLLLHSIHSPFYWRILKNTILYSGYNSSLFMNSNYIQKVVCKLHSPLLPRINSITESTKTTIHVPLFDCLWLLYSWVFTIFTFNYVPVL
jgi:hypothetical protein